MRIHNLIPGDRAWMDAGRMTAAIGVIDLPLTIPKIGFQHEYMMPPDCHHSRRWRGPRKAEPVGSKPERTDRGAEYPNRCPATAEGPRWAPLRMSYDGCRFPAFRDSLDGLPPLPMHPDLDRAHASEEVRLIGTGTHYVASLDACSLGLCPKRKGGAYKRRRYY